MEKIKNILSGNKHDDTVTSDNTTGTTSGLHAGTTGQSSGLASGSTTGNQTTGFTGEGSHLAGTRDTLGSSNTSGPTGNTASSGLGNTQNTAGTGLGNTQNVGLSSGTTTAGPHSSNLANKADPRVDSDLDGSRTVGNNAPTGTGYGSSTGNTAPGYGTSTGMGNTSTGTGYGTSTGNTPGYGSSTGVGNTNTQSGNTGYSGPHTTEAANMLDPSVNRRGGTELETAHHHHPTHGGGAEEADNHHRSHLGRDAAVGAGGVGLAEHEHHKHQQERGTGLGSTTGTGYGQSTGAYENTPGSTGHQSSHLGRDAALGVGGVGLAEHEHHKRQNERAAGVGGTTGTGLGQSTGAYDNTTGTSATGQQSHLGRDAGIGAAGVGASTLPGPAPNTAGPHRQDWANKLDPRVNANPDQLQSTGHGPLRDSEGQAGTGAAQPYDSTTGSTSHHAGRDAAAVGALGGAGAYEAGRHHDHQTGTGVGSGVGGTSSTTTAGPHSSNLANRVDPTVDSDRSRDHHYGRDAGMGAAGVGAAGVAEHEHHKHQNERGTGVGGATGLGQSTGAYDNTTGTSTAGTGYQSHLGRDAGIAGGVGAAGYEAEKHHQKHDKDLTAAEREAKKEHKHELKEEKKEHKKGGLLSFLHRDKNKKYTPEEEAEFDRQEREYNSHKGRDALGGAAVGGAAYEAEKHHHGHHNTSGSGIQGDASKALPTAPGNHGIGTGAGTQNALAGDNTASTSSGHHLGRDAALVGGAGAVGAHEHNKHAGTAGSGVTQGTPLSETQRGTDLGDKLHGVERNRGVPGPTGFPDSQDYGTGSSTTGTTGTTGQHHYGRDATALGGAAALGEHEHRKHERENVGSSGIGDQTSGITGSSTGTGNQHHLGRDAAVGAGGVGLAEHEHRKHEGFGGSRYDDPSSGLTGSNQGLTGGQYDNTSSGLAGSTQGRGHQHHVGRDAALGAGAVGGAGLAEHEHRKHEGLTSGRQDHATSFGVTGNQGLGGNEYRKDGLISEDQYGTAGQQYDTTGQQYGTTAQPSGLTGQQAIPRSGYDSNLTSSNVTGSNTTGGIGDDRNRLHKDPPADHPAGQVAQGGMPANAAERGGRI